MFFGMTKKKAEIKLQIAFATGNFTDAIAAYKKMIVKTPNDHQLFNNLGIAYMESGELQQSIDALNEAIRLSPLSVHYDNLGRALLKQKNFEAAREAFNKARELDPADPEPWYNITKLLREEGRPDEARQALHEFLQSHPKHSGGMNDLGAHYLLRGEKAEAIRWFTSAVENNPTDIKPRMNLIRILCDEKRYEEVKPHLEKLKQLGLQVKMHVENDKMSIEINGMPYYLNKT